MSTKILQLEPIKETIEDYEKIELAILLLFRKEIYLPLIAEIKGDNSVLKNSTEDLLQAILSGRINFYRGKFTGQFSSKLSRALRSIGAEWDRREGVFSIPQSKLPIEVRNTISMSEARLRSVFRSIDTKIGKFIPSQIAEKLKIENLFDRTLFKVEKDFQKSIKSISIAPELSDAVRARISKEYTQNLQLYIQDFAQKEMIELRKKIQERSIAGFRYESMIEEIQKSYGVTQNKAKFLARQETSLMMTKFKQTRYQEAGVNEYKWRCVAGSTLHPVRPMHKALDGKTYSWDNPPIVNDKGERKNPGQDYNCRCFAVPIVRF